MLRCPEVAIPEEHFGAPSVGSDVCRLEGLRWQGALFALAYQHLYFLFEPRKFFVREKVDVGRGANGQVPFWALEMVEAGREFYPWREEEGSFGARPRAQFARSVLRNELV